MADGTLKRYEGAWAFFRKWCRTYCLSFLPAAPLTVAMYLAQLLAVCIAKDYQYGVVKNASSAIYKAHQLAGLQNVTDHPMVKAVRQGAAKTLGLKLVHRKCPFSLVLCASCSIALAPLGCPSSQLRVACYIMICFAGLLRYDDACKVQWELIRFSSTHVELTLATRKNSQYRQGEVVKIARGSTAACPVRLLWRLSNLPRATPCNPFVFGDPGGSTPWSYDRAVAMVLGSLASFVGLSLHDFTARYGMHSFRSGGTTRSAAAGAPHHLLQAHGGWRNPASMQVYIERPLVQSLLPSQLMGY